MPDGTSKGKKNEVTPEVAAWVRASAMDHLRRTGDESYLQQVAGAAWAAGGEHLDEVLDAYNQGKADNA